VDNAEKGAAFFACSDSVIVNIGRSRMDLSDYTLSTVHQDDGFVLCRGQAVAGRMPHPPSILALMPASERPGPDRIGMLEHEFALRSELKST
jgi:hypothetical protein